VAGERKHAGQKKQRCVLGPLVFALFSTCCLANNHLKPVHHFALLEA
jgi:hypothetical protein